ncbi:MAG: endonuclease/exonuclease/phosphatase family protein [Paludibacter sp.]|nr:endonuclease/exonuclease/phosphatase family protein [Paludibacter sp.]
MTKINLKISLLFLLITFSSVLFAQSQKELKVMTFNLRFGELSSLEQMAEYIKGQQPDLVALQECDWKTIRQRAPKQAGKAFVNELAYHTGLFGLYGKAIDYGTGYYGVGILSKYPIIKSERIFLPNPAPQKEQRVMLIAEIEMPDKSVLTFISTHLEVSSAKTREEQIKFINEKIRSIKTPILLAGDFNAIPTSEEISKGFPGWFNATDTSYTYSSTKPEIKIDYIFGYPKKYFSLISTKVDTSCQLSDHFPVNSVISISSNK